MFFDFITVKLPSGYISAIPGVWITFVKYLAIHTFLFVKILTKLLTLESEKDKIPSLTVKERQSARNTFE